VPVLPILAYSGVGAFRNTAMTNTFESADASKDSFARSRLPVVSTAAAATPGSTPSAQGSGGSGAPTGAIAAGAAVIAAGAYWLWRRKSRADHDDGLDEKHS
jgi:hypothetical protein